MAKTKAKSARGRKPAVRGRATAEDFWKSVAQGRMVKARYDAAQTTGDNRKHWMNADAFDADSSAPTLVRRTLRMRSRYEVANNPYLKGMVETLANDVVGPGPRLQMLMGEDEGFSQASEDPEGDDPDSAPSPEQLKKAKRYRQINRLVEREFAKWCKKVRLGAKLRTMRKSKCVDGEAFALFVKNPKLDHRIKLDIRPIEADQVATPFFNALALAGKLDGKYAVDGIRFDEHCNPIGYDVLLQHPGSLQAGLSVLKSRPFAAQYMIHWYRQDRPSQSRGLPEILASLSLFPKIRLYSESVVDASINAALIALFMKTTVPAGGEPAEVPPMTEMEFSKNMAVFGPEGWEPMQIRAEQPINTYREYVDAKINEAARPLNMPKNIALCDSSGYNYASGRLDHQTYFKSIDVERDDCETDVLDRIFDTWMTLAAAEYGFGVYDDYPHQWFWTGREHVDPAKEAVAQAQRLASNTTTLADEYGKVGDNWEPKIRQRAREIKLCKELGLPVGSDTIVTPTNPQVEDPEEPPAQQAKPAKKPPATKMARAK